MANICCDDVIFYTEGNPEGLQGIRCQRQAIVRLHQLPAPACRYKPNCSLPVGETAGMLHEEGLDHHAAFHMEGCRISTTSNHSMNGGIYHERTTI